MSAQYKSLFSLFICVICLISFANALHAAAPTKIDAPWAVYLPLDPGDTAGDADPNLICTGSDIDGWRTFIIIDQATKLPLANNSDVYAAGIPKVTKLDLNKPSAVSGYILIEFLYINPFTTPSKDLAQCQRYDGTDFLFGANEYEPSYRSSENLIRDSLTPYWISTNEIQQKTWISVMSAGPVPGDLLPLTPGDLLADIQGYLTLYGAYPAANQFGLILDPAQYANPEMALHCVNYTDVQNFCSALGLHTSGKGVRIPNEREWEYAARAAINLYAPKDVVYGGGDWGIHDPITDNKLSIGSVFSKKYHPTDIPYNLTQEIMGMTQTGVDGSGNKILESKIVSLEYEILPELDTDRDFKFVLGQDIKYDKRYPAKFVPLKTFIKRDRTLTITNSSKTISGECYLSCDENGVDDLVTEQQEYYKTEQDLARAVQGLYMPVDVNGHYAAAMSGGLYKYDETLVSHFELVGVSGTQHNNAYTDSDVEFAIWPRNHGPNSTTIEPVPPMNPFNTVLTYFTYVQFESNVVFKGRPVTFADLSGTAIADARSKLQAEVRSYDFANSPSGMENWGGKDVLIRERSNISKDLASMKSKIHGLNRAVAKGNPTHKWYHVYTKYGGGNPGDPDKYIIPTTPINNFGAHEKPYSLYPSLNNWSLIDICGNIAELCIPNDSTNWAERWDGTSDYANHTGGDFVVSRGGSWNSPATGVRFGARRAFNPLSRSPEVGFRIVIEP